MNQLFKQQYYVGQLIKLKLSPDLEYYLRHKQIDPKIFVEHPHIIKDIPVECKEHGLIITATTNKDKFDRDELFIYLHEIEGAVNFQLVFFPMD